MIPWLGWTAIAAALLLPPLGRRVRVRPESAGGRAATLLGHPAALAFLAGGIYLVASSAKLWVQIAALFAGAVWIGVFWIVTQRRRDPYPAGAGGSGSDTEEGRSDGEGDTLSAEAKGLLRRLVSMKDVRIDAILTPREEMVVAECGEGVRGALGKIRSSGRMRIPMIDGSIDRITGVIHAKDLISMVRSSRQVPALKGMMRRPLFVAGDSSAADLLELFRSTRAHLAIVVDPFGRTIGLVTRRDLFRHLMGEEGESR